MTEATRRFYDELADDYHLIFADWDASIARQAAALDSLIVTQLGPGSHMILDCAWRAPEASGFFQPLLTGVGRG